MNNAWTVEFTRILVVIASALLFGLVSGAWVLAVSIAFAVYVAWMLTQIRFLERWIRLGTKNELAPDSNGIWQLIVQHIVHAQRKNQERKRRLRFMARRFEAIISALPDATLVINSQREIELTNQASFDLLGVDKKRDLGQRIDNLIREPRLLSLITEPKAGLAIEIESPIDRLKTLSVSCVDFGHDQKLITARDVSQRIAVQKLRKAFIANASHELRTPLTVISGYLELLETEPDLSDAVKKQIENAGHQASRMQKILDDLLMLSKLEEKGFDKRSGKTLSVPTLIRNMTDDYQKARARPGQKIKTDIDETLFLRANESEFFSLCQNLLSNAIKYSPENALISIAWFKSPEGTACLKVTDTGEGIAPEHISRLTERFFRVNVKRSRTVGGTGLGLSIVNHILENCGGALEIESELGRGSTFAAYFPKYRISNERPSLGASLPSEKGSRPTTIG